jgi:signal transduction histidine kinase
VRFGGSAVGYAACAVVVTGALAAVTVAALTSEETASAARAEARRAQDLRLALWPVQWSVAGFLAQESALDPVAFAVGAPRPEDPPYVRGRFTLGVNGAIAAPSEPAARKDGGARPPDLLADLRRADFSAALALVREDGAADDPPAQFVVLGGPYESVQFDEPAQFVDVGPASNGAAAPPPPNASNAAASRAATPQVFNSQRSRRIAPQTAGGPAPQEDFAQRRAQQEFEERFANTEATQALFASNNLALNPRSDFPVAAAGAPRATPFRGVWIESAGGPRLCFVRRFAPAFGAAVLHATWVDWTAFAAALAERVSEALPGATFVPYLGASDAPDPVGDRLAAAPARLVPSAAADAADAEADGTRRALVGGLCAAWAAVLAAVAGGGLLLRASQRLSERRGRFVSAVTHELRTPLTTFRLYSEMLADGMVRDPVTRDEYLATLKAESSRLARVVESVLLYARLEGGRGALRRERIDAAELVERALPPLARRCAEAGFELSADVEAVRGLRVESDAQAVEQVLVNLVDNACKYAADAEPKRIELAALRGARGGLVVRVRDRGPGVPAGEEERVFEPFRRSSTHAQSPLPGAGLGLALARGLARALGGDLRLVRTSDVGATFEFAL